MPEGSAWWAEDLAALSGRLGSGAAGLSTAEAARRKPSVAGHRARQEALRLFAAQFANPLVLILVAGALLSLVLREWLDAGIILLIVLGSGILGFSQEYRASQAVAELRSRLVRRVRVLRDGVETVIPVDDVVAGDVVVLKAGDIIPGDGRLIAADSLTTDEAVLTGEPYPVEKQPGTSPASAPIAARTGALFEGASVRSGTGRMLVVATGADTVFGEIAASLERQEQQTEFARGLSAFGRMLMRVMLIVVALVIAVSIALGRDIVSSLLFAMALAVAISPELLPAIVSVTLAAGARRMAQHGVLVRRLQAIENLGGMDVLCTDKTGTLTKGAIALSAAVAPDGQPLTGLLRLAAINAALQASMESPLDAAILAAARAASIAYDAEKLGEVAYDFERRRFSVTARPAGEDVATITKGAVREVTANCDRVRAGESVERLDDAWRQRIDDFVSAKGKSGFRVLAVATGTEPDAVLEGFLLFYDPPKPGIARTVTSLRRQGIAIRIISGDNVHVSRHLADEVGIGGGHALTGAEIAALDDAALAAAINGVTVFAEVEPQQKERIVRALQAAGHAVGYMGDGINDAPALRAADVGISVDSAVDVARESADIVLLRPELDAIRSGVEDGRRTFTNTLKYIAITISANFGNMVSMALATVLVPFLPLLPTQILLNNFLSDLPAVAIASDSVDPERLASAQRWDIGRIRRFMIVFGLISTAFDLATFAILLEVAKVDEAGFRTGWFVLSLLTELAALLVLRTRRPFYRSAPAPLLLWSSVFVAVVALALPFMGEVAAMFAFVPLSAELVVLILALVVVYALVTEAAKRRHHLMGD